MSNREITEQEATELIAPQGGTKSMTKQEAAKDWFSIHEKEFYRLMFIKAEQAKLKEWFRPDPNNPVKKEEYEQQFK